VAAIDLHARVALLDIEGTLGSIAFVRETLFPYANERLDAFVRERKDDPAVRAALDLASREAGVDVHDLPAILAALHTWSRNDVKVTPLKSLQGMIWRSGFESGAVRGHLYEDAIAAMRRFAADGIELDIYSSGSIEAQQLLFTYSVAGDLSPLIRGYYDTTSGPKREAASYRSIAAAIGAAPNAIAFFSDNAAELDAAKEAGMQTVQLVRPEDGTTPCAAHAIAANFDEIALHG
jgi:enolase-phosphatase E1